MIKIDSHQHYWNPARGDYGWMPKDNETLYRTYGPADLSPHMEEVGVDKSVIVQAANSVHETEYKLGIADAVDSVAGVVGWIDFEKLEDLEHLQRLANHPKFLGVRPMIQDIADDAWMLRDDVQWGYQALCDLGLTFDALGRTQHLDHFLAVFKRYPDMKVVLDHIMKPDIANETPEKFKTWADKMARIAAETNACCKLSGMVTEAGEDWTIETLRPYADHVLDIFGPERIMWGSDWPVCRLRCEYKVWHDTARALTAHLSSDAQDQIFGGTAVRFYGLAV